MKKGRKLALLGAWLQLSPLLGIVVPVVAMISGFVKMSDFDQISGVSTSSLEGAMMIALYAPLIAILGNIIGYTCLLVALLFRRYRSPWFFWFMTIYSALLLLFVPIGTVLGIIVLVYIIPRKKEFWCDQESRSHPRKLSE